jgi:hypothetical protein
VDEKDGVLETPPDPVPEDDPAIYSVEKDRDGWKFSRREFLTLAAAAVCTAVAGGPGSQKAWAHPIQLVGYSTEPPLSELSPGQPFAAVWQLRNSTGRPWGEGALLRLRAAKELKVAGSVALPNAAPGQTVAVRVPMVAPAELGLRPIEAAIQVAGAEYKTFLPIVSRAHGPCSCVGDVCTCVGDTHCTCVGDTPCTCVGHTPCTCVGDVPCTCDYDPPCVCDTYYCACDYDPPCVCDTYYCACDYDPPCACDGDCGCVGYVPCSCVAYTCGCVAYVPCSCVAYFPWR